MAFAEGNVVWFHFGTSIYKTMLDVHNARGFKVEAVTAVFREQFDAQQSGYQNKYYARTENPAPLIWIQPYVYVRNFKATPSFLKLSYSRRESRKGSTVRELQS